MVFAHGGLTSLLRRIFSGVIADGALILADTTGSDRTDLLLNA
jgi:hypothetical protein